LLESDATLDFEQCKSETDSVADGFSLPKLQMEMARQRIMTVKIKKQSTMTESNHGRRSFYGSTNRIKKQIAMSNLDMKSIDDCDNYQKYKGVTMPY
jgi:hypothetical protein